MGYAYLCQQFIATHGSDMGFADKILDVRALVATTDDEDIREHSPEQEDIFRKIVAEGL